MEVTGRDKFERCLAGWKRRDDVEDRGEAEERPTCEETECRMEPTFPRSALNEPSIKSMIFPARKPSL